MRKYSVQLPREDPVRRPRSKQQSIQRRRILRRRQRGRHQSHLPGHGRRRRARQLRIDRVDSSEESCWLASQLLGDIDRSIPERHFETSRLPLHQLAHCLFRIAGDLHHRSLVNVERPVCFDCLCPNTLLGHLLLDWVFACLAEQNHRGCRRNMVGGH